MNLPAHHYLTDPTSLAGLADAITRAPWIGIDTEGNSMFVYREQVCLIQLNIGGELFVIDTLALAAANADFSAVRSALNNYPRRIYLHGGEYDVGTLKRDYQIELKNVWDSQQAASLLGWEKTGYGSVVETLCGIKLDKAFAQYNWGTRPLDPAALLYALDDVIHLPIVCQQLEQAVAAADLEEEVAIANNAVAGTSWSGGFDPAGFYRIKGANEIPHSKLPLLCALFVWRDQLAQAANLPAGRLLNNEVLLALTRQAPTNFGLLKRMGLKSWFIAAHGNDLMDQVKAAQQNPPTIPERPRHRDVHPDEESRERRLKDWRRSEAENRTKKENRTVPLQVVLPAKSLDYLKQHGAHDLHKVPQLGAKRVQKYGDKLRELCSGQGAVEAR
jgi:ribonuclease D